MQSTYEGTPSDLADFGAPTSYDATSSNVHVADEAAAEEPVEEEAEGGRGEGCLTSGEDMLDCAQVEEETGGWQSGRGGRSRKGVAAVIGRTLRAL
jgi:hypothetical protein